MVFRQAAEAFDLDAGALESLLELSERGVSEKDRPAREGADLDLLHDRILGILERASRAVDRMADVS